MTLGQWLASRTPEPPSQLRARIETVLGDRLTIDATAEALNDAAHSLLAQLVASGAAGASRDPSSDDGGRAGSAAALDLLVVDALVTYAFEYAAETGGAVDVAADAALAHFGALAGARTAASADTHV